MADVPQQQPTRLTEEAPEEAPKESLTKEDIIQQIQEEAEKLVEALDASYKIAKLSTAKDRKTIWIKKIESYKKKAQEYANEDHVWNGDTETLQTWLNDFTRYVDQWEEFVYSNKDDLSSTHTIK